MLILLSNDDGIHSEGLTALRDILKAKHTVYVIAPERERTCVAHAITLHKPLRIKEVEKDVFSTSGTPADCVFLGVKTLLPGKPDFIVSGINRGPNMGQDVNYSGTVAAAKEGAFLGIPSISVSLSAGGGFFFKDAARVTEEIIDILSQQPLSPAIFLNINIPDIPRDEMRGFMVTRLGKRIYNDKVIERIDPRGGKYYWIGGDGNRYESIEGTDFSAIEKGYVSVTPLSLDFTSESSIGIYKRYFRGGR
ncbi:MAG: 5'/3'-nucleotidase SurE [Syntrophus sp. (in: bacteria)]|nr:5'/3'-nucleotidase SurE [Syntrophus sp. (in: bacteria)]